jgi:hypothetical protein
VRDFSFFSKQTKTYLIPYMDNILNDIHLKLPIHPPYFANHSISIELKSIVGASNTHNTFLYQGFDDFCIKYLGGLFLLVKFNDKETMNKALSNNTFRSHFKSIKPWNYETRISDRVAWITIAGLPPQFWHTETFNDIARHYGNILIPEECCLRQFNLSCGKVCILTNKTNFINETLHIPYNNEIFHVRVLEVEGDTDALFNGYVFNSSLNDDDTSVEGPEEGQTMGSSSENNEVSGDDSSSGEESDDVEFFTNKYPNTVCPGGVSKSLGFATDLSGEGSTSHMDAGLNDKYPSIHRSASLPFVSRDSAPSSAEKSTNIQQSVPHPLDQNLSQPLPPNPSNIGPINSPLNPPT